MLALSATFAPAHAQTFDVASTADTRSGPRSATLKVEVQGATPGQPVRAVVLVVNSSSGPDDEAMRTLVQAAVGAGYAAVALDTYTPRGIRDTIRNQEQVTKEEQFADIAAVVERLKAQPGFAQAKWALAGHSRGGILTFMAASAAFPAYWGAPYPRFDAYAALSPGCQPAFASTTLNGPLLIVSGERDDWTLPAPCARRVDALRTAGQPAQMRVLPGANHSFSTSGSVYVSSAIKFACPADRDYHYLRRESTGQPALIADPEGKAYTARELWKECAGPLGLRGRGVNAGGQRDRLGEATGLVIEFLRGLGW